MKQSRCPIGLAARKAGYGRSVDGACGRLGRVIVLAIVICGCAPDASRRTGAEGTAARGRPPVVTLAEYRQLRLRMPYAKVAAIVGAPGQEVARNFTPGIRGNLPSEPLQAYVWTNPDGSTLIAVFERGNLVQAIQSGLK